MVTSMMLADVQGEVDVRGVSIESVGLTGLYYPFRIRQQNGGEQSVTASIVLGAGLHEQQRGAHLSDLVQRVDAYGNQLFTMDDAVRLLGEVRRGQDERGLAFDSASLAVRFKYFLAKAAPASGLEALVPYDCGFDVALNGPGHKSVSVSVPVTTVCPCSLEISDVGAHNQRAEVTVRLWQEFDDERILWFEDIIRLVEDSASSGVYSLLKRVDEKALTELMFRTPRFVEDVVREAVVGIRQRIGRVRYQVRCESFESIHAHNAYAETTGVC